MNKDIASLCAYVRFQHFFLTEPHFPVLLIRLLPRLILAAIINKPSIPEAWQEESLLLTRAITQGGCSLVAGSFLPHDDSGAHFLLFCNLAALRRLGVFFIQWQTGRKLEKTHALLTASALK